MSVESETTYQPGAVLLNMIDPNSFPELSLIPNSTDRSSELNPSNNSMFNRRLGNLLIEVFNRKFPSPRNLPIATSEFSTPEPSHERSA